MRRLTFFVPFLAASLAACEYDNYAPPESVLKGRIVYEGQPVGVRDNAIQLELWQDGYALRSAIPVYVRQDGTFTAMLFDGEYKLARKQNVGPWENNPDTIRFELKGSHTVDVEVRPFFVIRNDNLQLSGSTLTATFDVQQVVPGREIETLALYVGATQFVDARYNLARREQAPGPDALNGPNTLTLDLASVAQGRDYVFARIGVKTRGVEELIYTQVKKIELR